MKTIETIISEQATGIPENPHGLGAFYSGPINRNGNVSEPGEKLSMMEAQDWLREGGSVGVPNAGAGSYRNVFRALGFSDCRPLEQSSSAGDWTFAVFDGEAWFIASQLNRYPRCGFLYSVSFDLGFPTWQAACDFAFSI